MIIDFYSDQTIYIENETLLLEHTHDQIYLIYFFNAQPPSSTCYYCKIPSLSPDTRHLCSGSVRSTCGLQKAHFWQQRHQGAIAFECSGSNEELDDDISYATNAINSSSRLLKSGRASSLAVPFSSGSFINRSNLQRKRHYSYSEKGK